MGNSLKDSAYNIIKSRILSCEYKPEQMLNEISLSQELGISRTPIREALSALEREMLVTVIPKKGTQVQELSADIVRNVFEIRLIFEPYIIRKYGILIDKLALVQVKKVQEKAKAAGKRDQYSADSDLHQLIISVNRNMYIDETLRNVYDQNQRIRIMTGEASAERLRSTADEHMKIINSLLCENYEKAAADMEAHLAASWEATINALYSSENRI